MIKSLLMTKFKYFGHINDDFFSRFFFFGNILFNFGSISYLLLSGIIRSDGVLTGIKGTPHRMSIFYLIVIGTLSAVSCLSTITIAVKKYQAYQSDKNLVKNINIMIINDGGEPKKQFNTQMYNTLRQEWWQKDKNWHRRVSYGHWFCKKMQTFVIMLKF